MEAIVKVVFKDEPEEEYSYVAVADGDKLSFAYYYNSQDWQYFIKKWDYRWSTEHLLCPEVEDAYISMDYSIPPEYIL